MNLYEILHISQDAPEEIIKLAYKGLAQKYHPDRYKGNDANEIMIKIREAYETLIDPIKRKNYDQFLTEQARRKQQQEEYIKKKEQEEFMRAQRAAFEQQNKTNSTNGSKHNSQEADSESFKMNISIDVPHSFSIFSPFIKFKNWIISKKKVFIQIGSTCIALALIFIIVIVANSYMQSLSDKSDVEAILAAEEAREAAEEAEAAADAAAVEATGIEEDYSLADSKLMNDSEEVYAESDEANTVTDERAMSTYETGLLYYLQPNPAEIKTSSKQVYDTFKESGIIGIKDLISNCYITFQKSKKCLYLDLAGKYINDSGADAGLPADEFFENEAIIERMNNNFYIPNKVGADLATPHAEQIAHQTYETIEKIISDEMAEM